jgi:peroxiredoxin Q/BCP
MASLKVGDKAPDFRLAADDGTQVSLADFCGKFVLFYFFPKALTPG